MEEKRAALKRLREEVAQLEKDIVCNEQFTNAHNDMKGMTRYSVFISKFFENYVKNVIVSDPFPLLPLKNTNEPCIIFEIELEVPFELKSNFNGNEYTKEWFIKCSWTGEYVNLILYSIPLVSPHLPKGVPESFEIVSGFSFHTTKDMDDDGNYVCETEVFGDIFHVSEWFEMETLRFAIFTFLRAYLIRLNSDKMMDWIDEVQSRI